MQKSFYILIVTALSICLLSHNVLAQPIETESTLDLGDEFEGYRKERYKKSGSGRSKGVRQEEDSSLAVAALLYIPNRILDILDIVRFDVGVGPSVGGVVRLTEYGQAGVRLLMPVSVRAGLRGRRLPVFIEHGSEMGIGPAFLSTEDRKPSVLEVGAGIDLFIAGVYLGISLDSIADAIVGFAGYDPAEDDL